GVSVAVIQDGVPLLVRGYGMADLEGHRPAAADTIYRIGSITKSFTAAAIMKLVADGKVALDEPITTYLSDYDTHGATITVRNLLNHTSGIKGYTEIDAFWPRSATDFPRAELVEMFSEPPLEFPPGSRWQYSNSGYYLLGMIIEKVTGKRYADVVRERLTAPAGLADTSYCPDRMTTPRQARPYEVDGGKVKPADAIAMSHPFAAGALCSTVLDLAHWIDGLNAGRIVTPAQWADMTRPVKLADGRLFPYGFGIMAGELGGHRKLGHNGGINGFHSKVEIYPDDHLVIAVLANTGEGVVEPLADALARTALGVPEAKVLDVPLGSDEAALYVGRFHFEDVPVRLAFRYQDGALQAANLDESGNPGNWLPLHHQGNHVFVATEVKARITFVVEGGKVTGIQVEQGGLHLHGTPMPE
ncbi:MAG TPA: serine hydrolase domain-containing protein, partial [Kofleriaceae bacterium]|nr:serine hydrolase domain-containing protein [Kofleriaceae bacterium]